MDGAPVASRANRGRSRRHESNDPRETGPDRRSSAQRPRTKCFASSGGVDAAIVFAPSSPLLKQAIRGIKAGGVIVVGAFAEVGELPFVEEKTVVGSVLGSREQMHQLLRLAGAGKVHAAVESFRLDDAVDALRRLKRGEFEARAVVVP